MLAPHRQASQCWGNRTKTPKQTCCCTPRSPHLARIWGRWSGTWSGCTSCSQCQTAACTAAHSGRPSRRSGVSASRCSSGTWCQWHRTGRLRQWGRGREREEGGHASVAEREAAQWACMQQQQPAAASLRARLMCSALRTGPCSLPTTHSIASRVASSCTCCRLQAAHTCRPSGCGSAAATTVEAHAAVSASVRYPTPWWQGSTTRQAVSQAI